MEANKSESEKCIRIAKTAISNGETEKAIKFLDKSFKLYPTDEAKILMSQLQDDDDAQTSNTNNNSNNSQSASASPKLKKRTHAASAQNTDHKEAAKPAEYTSEQLDAVRKIKACKDFYEILGLTRTASDVDLKKQYKKLALQFHPDKNKAPGATEAFKAIGKAFAVLNDPQKRKQYDMCPESFDESASSSNQTHRRESYQNFNNTSHNAYWNDDEFSAEEIFNLFFGGGFVNNSTSRQRTQRHRSHAHTNHNAQTNFTFTQSNNYAVLFQLMPILMIVVLSFLSSFMIGEPVYSLSKTAKYNLKRTTREHDVPYFVKGDFKVESASELYRLEKQIEEDLLMELRQNCFREKSYRDTAIWRARTYGDDRLLKKATEIETPSCNKISSIFKSG